VNHVAHVDFHRARRAAQTVGGASLIAVVLKFLYKTCKTLWVLVSSFETRNLTFNNDALTRREREAAAQAVDLAESALDALVNVVVSDGHRFEILDEAIGVVIEITPGLSIF
jgi:hypothetical protein